MDTTNDPASELIGCCDVLWEELQALTRHGEDDPPVAPPHDELITAYWQTIELVNMMASELYMAYTVIEDYRQAQENAVRDTLATARSRLVGPHGAPL